VVHSTHLPSSSSWRSPWSCCRAAPSPRSWHSYGCSSQVPPLHHSSSTRGRAVGLGLPWANPRCPASGKVSLIHVDFDTATIRVLLSMTGVSRALSISQGTDGDDGLTIAPFNLFNLHPFKLRFDVAYSLWMETGVPLPPSIPSAQAR